MHMLFVGDANAAACGRVQQRFGFFVGTVWPFPLACLSSEFLAWLSQIEFHRGHHDSWASGHRIGWPPHRNHRFLFPPTQFGWWQHARIAECSAGCSESLICAWLTHRGWHMQISLCAVMTTPFARKDLC